MLSLFKDTRPTDLLRKEIAVSVEAWKKYLKVASIACVIVYSIFTVLGILILTPLIDSNVVLQIMGVEGMLAASEGPLFVTIAGGVIAVVYFILLLATIAVLRGAHDPSKMKPGMVLYGIITAFQVFSLITTLNAGGSVGAILTQLLVSASLFVGSMEVCRSAKQPI